jgi:hypothetical protein
MFLKGTRRDYSYNLAALPLRLCAKASSTAISKGYSVKINAPAFRVEGTTANAIRFAEAAHGNRTAEVQFSISGATAIFWDTVFRKCQYHREQIGSGAG